MISSLCLHYMSFLSYILWYLWMITGTLLFSICLKSTGLNMRILWVNMFFGGGSTLIKRWKNTKAKVVMEILYLWIPRCPLLLQERRHCNHSGGWRLKGGWRPAPWSQRAETCSGARGSAGSGPHRLEPRPGPFQDLRAGLLGGRVRPWWRAEHWREILRRVRKMVITTAVKCRWTHIHPSRLTWSALGVPVLRHRCYMVSQLLVVVMRDRRALPAQTFRSLKAARGRRKKSLMCWRCRGTSVEEGERETDQVAQQDPSIL